MHIDSVSAGSRLKVALKHLDYALANQIVLLERAECGMTVTQADFAHSASAVYSMLMAVEILQKQCDEAVKSESLK